LARQTIFSRYRTIISYVRLLLGARNIYYILNIYIHIHIYIHTYIYALCAILGQRTTITRATSVIDWSSAEPLAKWSLRCSCARPGLPPSDVSVRCPAEAFSRGKLCSVFFARFSCDVHTEWLSLYLRCDDVTTYVGTHMYTDIIIILFMQVLIYIYIYIYIYHDDFVWPTSATWTSLWHYRTQ